MTAAIPLLHSLSYIGGLFEYAVMGYVLAAWVGDAIDKVQWHKIVPRRPKYLQSPRGAYMYSCPRCECMLAINCATRYKVCPWCGQRLRRSKRDNKRVADARAAAGKSDHSITGQ